MSRTRCLVESIEPRLLFTRAVGIDVSHYQGTITWSSVKAAGIQFAFMKAGGAEGSSDNYETDAYFSSNASGATAQGIKLAPYYFPDPSNAKYTAVDQANNFYTIAGSRMGNGYLPPVIDVEDSGSTPTASSLGAAGLTTWVNAFCAQLYSRSGVKPTIYCNSNFAQNYLQRSVSQWTLWIANYNYTSTYDTTTTVPVGSGSTMGWPSNTWKFFQYTSSGTVSGISGGVDRDVFNGDNTAFSTYFTALKSTVAVKQGSIALTNNQAGAVDFGTVKQAAAGTSISFTVSNSGSNTLTTSGLTVPAGYTATDPLAASIVGGASDTVTLQLKTDTIGTFDGNVRFSTNDTAATSFAFPITGKVISNDTTPPTINSAKFVYDSATPSLSFTFSEDVHASLSTADFVITNDTTAATVTPSAYAYDSATNTATLGFAARLSDGNYTAAIAGSGVSDAASNVMANSYAFGFFSLAGDLNRDRKVDIVDLGILSGHWQATPALFADGDVNLDGKVDIVDLGILSGNWQASLATPAQPDGLRVTSTLTLTSGTAHASTAAVPFKMVPPTKGKVTTTLTPISQAVLM